MRPGKWLIFVSPQNAQATLLRVWRDHQQGRLGIGVKLHNGVVICVYTYDWKDVEDITRVEYRLRAIGITGVMPYKSDEATMAGRYGNGVSAYISR